MQPIFSPIPTETITGLRKNYTEKLPKTLRLKSAVIGRRGGRAREASDLLGITTLLDSDIVRTLAEGVSGKQLERKPTRQAICYEAGDFCGPHNDHHPEQPHLRDGYVDLHIMVSEPAVESQLLIYEKRRGLLNEVAEVGKAPYVAIYQLPFWHYVTPLIAKSGFARARRWVLMASYCRSQ
jgi:hypothetical protein